MRQLLFLILPLLVMPCFSIATENTPEETVAALWNAISNDAGATADVTTLQRIFHQDAVIVGGRYKEDKPMLRRSLLADFLKPFTKVQERLLRV